MVYQNKGEKRLYVFNKVHMETEWGEKTINIFEVLPLSIIPSTPSQEAMFEYCSNYSNALKIPFFFCCPLSFISFSECPKYLLSFSNLG